MGLTASRTRGGQTRVARPLAARCSTFGGGRSDPPTASAPRCGPRASSAGARRDRLRALERTREAIDLTTDAPCDLEFVGVDGEVQRRVRGTHARMSLSETGGPYLRARVRDDAGRMAWTQPIWRADRP